jgi:hypothetical protein
MDPCGAVAECGQRRGWLWTRRSGGGVGEWTYAGGARHAGCHGLARFVGSRRGRKGERGTGEAGVVGGAGQGCHAIPRFVGNLADFASRKEGKGSQASHAWQIACMWFLFLYRSKNYGKSWEFLLHAHKFWIIFSFPVHARKTIG